MKKMPSKYVIIGFFFVIWMLFFDTNSWLVHRELNQELDKIAKNKEYYRKEIAKDQKIIEKLNDTVELQKFARETYYLKKENEDIYLIELNAKNTNE